MAKGNVQAVWCGGAGFELSDGTALVPGETVVELPASHAEDPKWQPVKPKAKRSGKAKAKKDEVVKAPDAEAAAEVSEATPTPDAEGGESS